MPLRTNRISFLRRISATFERAISIRPVAVLTSLVVLCFVSGAHAQTITLTEPRVELSLVEGDDFATSKLHNPWDFSERRDFGWEESFVGGSIAASGGVWSGQVDQSSAYVFPLFHGFPNTVLAEGLPGDRELPKFGTRHPIEAARYSLLSYRSNISHRTAHAIYWNRAGEGNDGWPNGSDFVANSDALGHFGEIVSRPGFEVAIHDMSNLGQFEQSRGAWSGDVMSLRFDPSTGSPSGGWMSFDWVRLADPRTGSEIRVAWQSNGIAQIAPVVSVYLDQDSSGYDGSALKHYIDGSNPGVFTLNSAALPPGRYYFYVTAHQANGSVVARSAYSAPIVIRSRPQVQFLHPSPTSGEEYSRSTGNTWDMSESADVSNLSGWPAEWVRFVAPAFAIGEFQAVAVAEGATTSDAQVHVPVLQSAPIDTARYRYLTYKLAVDGSGYPTIADKVRDGWVARTVFWGPEKYSPVGSTKAHILYEGSRTYTYDLWDAAGFEPGPQYRSSSFQHYLRIDPVETSFPTRFWLDYVALHAEPRTTLYSDREEFDFHFTVEDPDSNDLSVVIGLDSDAVGFDGEEIATLGGLRPGAHSYRAVFPLQGNERRLYPYVRVSDAAGSLQAYAQVPILLGPVPVRPDVPITITPPVTSLSAVVRQLRVSRGVAVFRANIVSPTGVRRAYLSLRQRGAGRAQRIALRRRSGSLYEGTWRVLRPSRANRFAIKLAVETLDGKRVVKDFGTL